MQQRNFYVLLLLLIAFTSCNKSSNKEKIIGKWTTVIPNRIEGIEIPMPGPENRVVLTFNEDMTLKSEGMRGDEIMETNTGTYDFEEDERFLVVYREGMKDRKNVSEIVELTDKILTLVDTSGGGDSLKLKKEK